ncbi:fungal-specific transcription factor domain-containing protein [Rhizodiscina lignyota]|uniref:Fungal-specific transcription factor domain-containing protein n=1 Tax=Rhizodiscina lignyota TaxID=1504668 RepID=A0A9P4I5R3_9PEZI|nr:fungal-specific transcription factor domain-containing protein [Rhizodiscina lignyota]
MFTTFSGIPPDESLPQNSDLSGSGAKDSPRLKRQQVARACDWCRAHRIKCDASYPCRNCRSKGRECSTTGSHEVRTYSLAIKEIERLKNRVEELEHQIDGHCCTIKHSRPGVSLPANLDPLKEHGGNRRYWECIYTKSAHSQSIQCYGPSSAFYFIGRFSAYLSRLLMQPQSDELTQLLSASKVFAKSLGVGVNRAGDGRLTEDGFRQGSNMTRAEEEYFLSLFWSSYHCIYPILDEHEFKGHYASLWQPSGHFRKPSALVDIVLAVCMQYGTALIPPGTSNAAEHCRGGGRDAMTAGRNLYRRCQALLTEEWEGPSVATLQCHLFSVIYLSNASFPNAAHNALALAIRTGIILGFHLEPPESLPRAEKAFRKRLWWSVYVLEMKAAMELGRPLAVNISQVTCGIPLVDEPERGLNPTSQMSSEYLNCLDTNSQFVKLMLATRSVYVMFYNKSADVLGKNGQDSLYEDPQALEKMAEFLSSKMEYLRTWSREVPESLKMQRRDAGDAFSTAGSTLDLCPFVPFQLQRQRLFLELQYHSVAMYLHRPFICCGQTRGKDAPLIDENASTCTKHAIVITNMIHQVLSETDLLNGWNETFQWQWQAALTMIGYVMAFPLAPSTPLARENLDTAIAVFDHLSSRFVIAISAANVTRDLCARSDFLIERFAGLSSEELEVINSGGSFEAVGMANKTLAENTPSFEFPSSSEPEPSRFRFDCFASLESICTGGTNISDTWSYGVMEDTSLELLMGDTWLSTELSVSDIQEPIPSFMPP